jgi:hypothetical protein
VVARARHLEVPADGDQSGPPNQFETVDITVRVAMAALIVGELGGFAVLLAGFVAGQFF